MAKITIDIDCKEETCWRCNLVEYGYCFCFDKKLEMQYEGEELIDALRLPECKKAETKNGDFAA